MKIVWHGEVGDTFDWKVGDAFYDDDYPRAVISALHVGKRPIVVILPGRIFFCIYSKQSTDGIQHEPGWTVTGEPDAITMQPSVDCKGLWHGTISNGNIQPEDAL